MPTQIADVVVPSEFSAYVSENSLVSTALFESGVLVRNPLIDSHLAMGSNNFNVPFWLDLGENDPDITNDNPAQLSTPLKLAATIRSFGNPALFFETYASSNCGANRVSAKGALPSAREAYSAR